MQRRRFLASVTGGSALIAGCLSLSSGDDPGTNGPQANDTDDRSPTDTAPDGSDSTPGTGSQEGQESFWRDRDELPEFEEPTVVSFETAPVTAVGTGRFRTDDGIRGEFDFETGATPDSPATLRVVLANTRPWEQTLRADRLLVLDDPALGYDDDHEAVYLAPTADHPIAEREPGYERDSEGRWRLQGVGDRWFPETVTFPPEKGFAAEYRLLGHHERDEPPIRPGRYDLTWRDARLTIVAWPTDSPGPDGSSAFDGARPPALPGADEMAWYHDATPGTGTFLRLDAETVEPPATIDLAFVNHSDRSAGGNPYYWRVYKLVGGEWLPIAPWMWNQPYLSLGPGSREPQQLALFHGPGIECREKRVVDYLGGGTYAYESAYSVDEETHAAMFEVDAPPVAVDPEDAAEITDEGDRIVVELPGHTDARRPATATVTRADGSRPEETLLPEQLPRRPMRVYRNSLPLFEAGVDTVQVETDRGTALGPLGYEETTERIVEYRGETYRVTAEITED